MPIHPRFKKALREMSKRYCKGSLNKNVEGVQTCSKALSVFYATMKTKNIDYTKAPTEETIQQLENVPEIDKIIEWYIKNECSN